MADSLSRLINKASASSCVGYGGRLILPQPLQLPRHSNKDRPLICPWYHSCNPVRDEPLRWIWRPSVSAGRKPSRRKICHSSSVSMMPSSFKASARNQPYGQPLHALLMINIAQTVRDSPSSEILYGYNNIAGILQNINTGNSRSYMDEIWFAPIW